jgi:hypothetical protein
LGIVWQLVVRHGESVWQGHNDLAIAHLYV